MNAALRYERYRRQIKLKEFGVAAQEKLFLAKVLVVGAGGLGCPVLQYLAASGVGTIGIVDDDIVSLTNLHRQVLYNMNDIGLPKAQVAARKLKQLNDEITIVYYNTRLANTNALSVISGYDFVVDGTDNFSSRYMINDACVLLSKPLIYAAIFKFEGQVAVFNVKDTASERAINYRDLFPSLPKDDEVLNCEEAGVLGVLPGIVGTMQANETIKLITGMGEPLINKLLTYNALNNAVYELNLSINEEGQQLIPKDEAMFLNMDYDWLCSASINNEFEIDTTAFNELITDNNTTIIDVREKDELPFVDEFRHLKIPLTELRTRQTMINGHKVVVFCQSGKRSLEAAKILREIFKLKKIYSLKKGIVHWKHTHLFKTETSKP